MKARKGRRQVREIWTNLKCASQRTGNSFKGEREWSIEPNSYRTGEEDEELTGEGAGQGCRGKAWSGQGKMHFP